ncbi:NADH-quinone oxidoreductase subunit N [Naumannella cuiyingiana]|uniref:NADH-quinone oxidoreductase subunit N n=1 Tax=Naumannella cuiyingiana TaxID=1347891 RepID=A0A7Z0IKM5_9ACTN|nr:NADH-quinone oxidoreductase subunit NuoN [Naumannella cuiyingiana]NYI70597.1 NADH-quinone oxidoreductase subunit N [Naumannella cuiyingiana]
MPSSAPSIDWQALLPLIIVFAGGVVGVLVESLLPRAYRSALQRAVAYLTVLAAFVFTGLNWLLGVYGPTAGGSIMVDVPSYFTWLTLLFFTVLALLLFGERRLYSGVTAFAPQAAATPGSPDEREAIEKRVEQNELYPLTMFALVGMMLFAASGDLLMMFVALEIMSLPLYVMCGLARRRRLLSQESSMKYFLLGALSSAIFVFGIALLYGFAGSFNLGGTYDSQAGLVDPGLAAAIQLQPEGNGMLFAGLAMVGIGLLFKIGAAPFASWVPDVYAGAPSPITAFMAVCTKIAAMVGLARVFFVAFGGLRWDWQPVLAIVAVASMAIGSVLAIAQSDVKRMLAYSSIAHAGFLLVAVTGAFQAAGPDQLTSLASVLFYLVAYGVTTMGAFAIVTMVRNRSGEVNQLGAWAGLGRKSPVVAGLFAYFLLSFAGIPLTAGFIGKWTVFMAAWRGGYAWLVVVAVLVSVIAAFFYVRVIVTMFFSDPAEGDAEVAQAGWGTQAVLVVSCVLTVVLAVVPGWLLTLSAQAGQFLR